MIKLTILAILLLGILVLVMAAENAEEDLEAQEQFGFGRRGYGGGYGRGGYGGYGGGRGGFGRGGYGGYGRQGYGGYGGYGR